MSPFDCRESETKVEAEWEIKCTDNLRYMKKMKDGSVDLIVTSPPYNVGKLYDEHQDQMDFEEYLAWQAKVLEECGRILKPGGSLCWQVGTFVEKPTASASGKRRRFRPLDYYFFDLIQDYCPELVCQSAFKPDPLSAPNIDPP